MLPHNQRPYIIYRQAPGAGFWSNFTVVLQALDDADREGHVPVVDMERHPTHYNEDGCLFDTRNAWEYYFEQPAGLSLTEALALNPLDNGGSLTGPFFSYLTALTGSPLLDRGRELVRKYVRVKPHVFTEVDALLSPGVHSQVLGVHVRGTDQRAGTAPKHPIPQAPSVYLEQAVALDQDHQFQKIFLACDEIETLELFRGHFGPRLVAMPAHRTAADGIYPADYKWLFADERNHHSYRLGLEVLQDVLLLARCGHFLFGRSNVSKSVAWFSDDRQVQHFLPPLWHAPPHRGPSLGRASLKELPPFPRPISFATLESQVKEMQRLLEMTENSRADAYDLLDGLHERLVVALTELKATHDNWVAAQQETKAAKKEAANLAKEAQRASAFAKQLQERIHHLTNAWTRLGWRLMPWTKPSWRHKPTTVSSKDMSGE